MKIQNLPGTRDFYPELQAELNYIFDVWKTVSIRYGYREMDGPLLESIDVLQLKVGDEIPQQMYTFTDKGGRDVAIRAELTPTVARMVAQKQKELIKPIKWFAVTRFWRYERPQSGRLREFYQFNLDCLGVDSMKADAEVIATAVDIMRSFDLNEKDFYVRLGNRKLLESLFLQVVRKDRLQDVFRLVDKKDKIDVKEFNKGLKDLGVEDVKKLKEILDYKNLKKINYKKLDKKGKEGYKELKDLLEYLENYGLGNYIELDFAIMRGFDYYTSTVFEIFDKTKEFRSLAGGGRYEDLVSDFGGEKCPGIGYGLGDVVLALFLKKKNKMPKFDKKVDYFILTIGDVYDSALKLASKLRDEAYVVEVALSDVSTSKQLKYAKRIGAEKIVYIGDNEVKKKEAKVKDVKTGKESILSL